MFADAVGLPFALRSGVEELVARRAFSRSRGLQSRGNSTGTYPGVFFQLMYYDKLRLYDSSYNERYSELYSLMLVPTTRPSDIRATRARFEGQDIDRPLQRYAPKEKSLLDEIIKPINLVYTQARLLDANNKPKLSIITSAFPTEVDDVETLTNSLIINDANWNKLETIDHTPIDILDNTSVFLVNHNDSTYNYVLTSEAFASGDEKLITAESQVKTDKIQYIGKEILERRSPLSQNSDELEVSDLLVGIDVPGNSDLGDYPFPILPTNQIHKGDPLKVYVELYHLFFGLDGKAKYSIKLQVARSGKKGVLNKLILRGRKKEVISQTYTNEAQTTTVKESVSFDVSELKNGEYEFLIEILDLVSGQTKQRFGEFKIIE